MRTVVTTNNGYDSILLVDDNDKVVSAWGAEKATLEAFVRDTDAAEWNEGEWHTFGDPTGEEIEDELRTIAAFGEECGRDGVIASDERKRFWFRD